MKLIASAFSAPPRLARLARVSALLALGALLLKLTPALAWSLDDVAKLAQQKAAKP